MLFDVGIHLCLEAMGGLVYMCAYRFCEHRWHQAIVWCCLAPPMSVLTVQLVG